MEILEIFACSLLLIAFAVLLVVAIRDALQVQKLRQREELRRETIKNTLQDICEKLDDISKALWYEK